MSLYTWLQTNPVIHRKNPEQSFWKYYTTHEQQLLEDPKYVYWKYMPPTFVTYQVQADWNTLLAHYEDQIKETILKYSSNITDEQVGLIIQKVLENIDPTIEVNIEQKIIEAFAEIGIISNEEIDEITSN